ncbi:glycosyl hydrolase family 18 protein [Chitinibacteraceae bacterium HSL-7]
MNTRLLAAVGLLLGGLAVAAEPWNVDRVYVKNDVVEYKGATYKAQWWTQGEAPGSGWGAWSVQQGTGDVWLASRAYAKGEQVTHNGTRYEARWWTQGDVPGKEGGVWLLVGPAKPLAGKLVAYLPTWRDDATVAKHAASLRKVTHGVLSFIEVDETGKAYLPPATQTGAKAWQQAFAEARKVNPKFECMWAIGGWTGSRHIAKTAQTEQGRERLADSAVAIMRESKCAGLDLDWEHPVTGGEYPQDASAADFANWVSLLRTLRERLDAAGKQDGKRYVLSVATPATAGGWAMQGYDLKNAMPLLDWVNLMAYDRAGGWSRVSTLQAALHPVPGDPDGAVLATRQSVDFYLAQGAKPEQLVVGVPFYARALGNVEPGPNGDGLAQPMSGVGMKDEAEPGVASYADLKARYLGQDGWVLHRSVAAGNAPYLYHAGKRELITYDDPVSLAEKVRYARLNQLGGMMVWEVTQDDASASLLNALYDGLTGPAPQPDPTPVGGLDAVQASGRVVLENGSVRYSWPGVYFDARFSGTAIGIKLDDAGNHYDVVIDGEVARKVSAPGNATVWVRGLPAGEHSVRLIKRNDAPTSIGRFLGFVVEGDGKLLAPPKPKTRQLEFIGDSFVAALANESTKRENCSEAEISATTDAGRSFGALTAQHYGGDFQINGYSGLGLVRNYAGNLYPTNYRTYADRALQSIEGSVWQNDGSWKPQVVFIGLGINDFNTPVKAGEAWTQETHRAEYKAAYGEMIAKLRARYGKDALIVAAKMRVWREDGQQELFPSAIDEIVADAQAGGDKRIVSFQYDPTLSLMGCGWHPTLADHAKVASQLVEVIDRAGVSW